MYFFALRPPERSQIKARACKKSAVYKRVHEHFLQARNAELAMLRRSQSEKVVGRVGIEPTTGRLKAECSTSELTPHLGTEVAGPPPECRRHDTR